MPIFGWESLKSLGQKKQPKKETATASPATKCAGCGEILIKKTLEDNLGVCQVCKHHHRISADMRIAVTLDEDTFAEMDADLASIDILGFQGRKSYTAKLKQAMRETGMISAMRSGIGRLEGRPVAFGVTDSSFIMGSMGSVVGEKFTRLAERALRERLPLIVVSGSGGGARMYEGMYSLMQMAKTSAALGRLREAGVPFLSVVTDCTMAGVWASWAALGDVILAEPKALVGFTGPRVIKTTINCVLPEGFQLSEFLLAHGQVDQIVPRDAMRKKLAHLLKLMIGPVEGGAATRVPAASSGIGGGGA